jgi:acyl carrier protein
MRLHDYGKSNKVLRGKGYRAKADRQRVIATSLGGMHVRNLSMSTAAETFAADRVSDIIREILARRSDDRSIGPILRDDDLREAGFTSLDMVNLMLAVEAEFELKIPDADMTLSNFQSISAIEALVSRIR